MYFFYVKCIVLIVLNTNQALSLSGLKSGRIEDNAEEMRCRITMILHHDNGPAHRATTIKEMINKIF